jgi:multiple antibiotic resistance protein
MRDTAYVFTIFFLTLGPLKIIPPFALVARGMDFRARLALAVRATVVASLIALAIFYGGSHVVVSWRLSTEAIALAGGMLLFVTALKTITSFSMAEMSPPSETAASALAPAHDWRTLFGVLARPALTPIAIPATITPIGVVALFYFAAATRTDPVFQDAILVVLLQIMVLNLLAMIGAPLIMRVVGVMVLQAVGWVMSALQAALAVQIVIGALRRLQIIP